METLVSAAAKPVVRAEGALVMDDKSPFSSEIMAHGKGSHSPYRTKATYTERQEVTVLLPSRTDHRKFMGQTDQ
ncbi:hypothetical protein [Phaeobacter inhibens]|uniref:hypothetical protein n=1 Tax=Phaeobacter inhibens TaxID=221822 RepID=UPI0012DD7C60|nr:hypothetical protein [Phaeobacter inhibens]